MPLTRGSRVGSYEILSALGAGGMGEVYRARDSKLGRDVAIKSLSSGFLFDPERVARLQREATLLASLNHPNIAAIYGVEEADGAQLLVLELVDGETLAQLIARGPLPLDEALAIARQVADALESAHEKGIIHRDLKPANIALTHDGQVKILDFGLAKAIDPAESLDASMSPTMSIGATRAGVILGTAAYMSPEQAKGRPTDKRTDVWAFGCVLFEMLTGKRAFEGDNVTDIIAAVVRADLDWSALPATVPESIRLLLRRCLEKDRRQRISDVSVARFLMNEGPALAEAASAAKAAVATAAPETPSPASRLAWVAAGVVGGVLVTALAAWVVTRRTPPAPLEPVRFTITPSPQPFYTEGNDRDLAITPDGRHIVYLAGAVNNTQLMVRDLANPEAKVVATGSPLRSPFVSPDGRWIGYFSKDALMKVPIDGGPSVRICATSNGPRGATWGDDGTIVFATAEVTSGLLTVSANGGEPKPLTMPDTAHGEVDHIFPSFLPGNRALLFTVTTSSFDRASSIDALEIASGQRKTIVKSATLPTYVDTGHLLYVTGNSLLAAAFDPAALAVTGDPVPVVDQLMTLMTGAAEYAVSRHGSLVYVIGSANQAAEPRSLVWVNRQGREEPIPAPVRSYMVPRISPDGTRAALDIRDRARDIWIWDFKRQTLTPLTLGPRVDMSPAWTADGTRIVWSQVMERGTANIFWQAADGTGTPERVTDSDNAQFAVSTTRDGKLLLFEGAAGSLQLDVGMMALPSPSAKSPAAPFQPLVATKAIELNPELSPDGRWLAYQSDKSGQAEIYVCPFPNVDGGLWQISSAGGTRPAWARNGRELFYLDAKNLLTAVSIDSSGAAFSAGNSKRMLETAYLPGTTTRGLDLRGYDIAPDGQRFLMIKDVSPAGGAGAPASVSLTVVLDWANELKSRARPKP